MSAQLQRLAQTTFGVWGPEAQRGVDLLRLSFSTDLRAVALASQEHASHPQAAVQRKSLLGFPKNKQHKVGREK